MKETIYTIPLNDAFHAEDECPFCRLERDAEQHALEFILGKQSSYMEDDIRMETDRIGFCRHHYKMMYDFGNRLGCGLMLSTHLKKLNEEMTRQIKSFTSGKSTLMGRLKKTDLNPDAPETPLGQWLYEKEHSCYVCDHFNATYQRYLDTFFYMYKNSKEFKELFKNSKGFCLEHSGMLYDLAPSHLSGQVLVDFTNDLNEIFLTNFKRVQEDVSWFVNKHDYRNKEASWKNSKDSLPRAMTKVNSILSEN